MRIEILQPYKSLQPFISEELPDFTVIIGKNGSGKSQLLDKLNTTVQLFGMRRPGNEIDETYCKTEPRFSKVQYQGLRIHSNLLNSMSSRIVPARLREAVEKVLNGLKNDSLFYTTFINNIDIPKQINKGPKECTHPDFLYELNSVKIKTNLNEESILLDLVSKYYTSDIDFKLVKEAILEAHQFSSKEYNTLTVSDVLNSTPINELTFLEQKLFSISIDEIIYGYCEKRNRNSYQFFRRERYGELNNAMTEGDFNRLFPPPWLIFNETLKEYKIPYEIKEVKPNEFDESIKSGYFTLIHSNTKKEIEFEDLSNGEEIIIGLLAKLFLSKSYQNSLELPEILLLDEPDSPLHPELIKLLIDVLKDTFVKKLGIKVILTTHSPTTVALSPEESIFELKNFENSSLKKIDKDEALKILTAGIPTLAIDYKNHRQVFVESPIDLKYYQLITDKYFEEAKVKPKHKLYFISNALGKGNCDSVKDIVIALRKSGNKTSFGIIDWDNKSSQPIEEYVLMHGFKSRYSIENFLFDPIYLFGLMVDKKKYKARQHFNLPEYFDSSCLVKESKEKLQEYCDYVVNDLVLNNSFKAQNLAKINPDMVEVKYKKQDIVIKLPRWWLICKGHKELIPILKDQAIPDLFKSLPNNHEIEENLSLIICKNYPLVPEETMQLIERLSN